MVWWEGVLVGLAVGAALSIILHVLITGTPPMPTLARERRAILAALPEAAAAPFPESPLRDGLPHDGPLMELGGGWGALALALAERYPERTVHAFERSPLPWAVCRLRALCMSRNLIVHRRDFFQADLSPAALVTCYLSPHLMVKLAPKLEKELRPGSMVISNTFAIPGWRAQSTIPTGGWFGGPILVYVADSERPT